MKRRVRVIAAISLGLMMVLLYVGIPAVVAHREHSEHHTMTRYSVVVSNAPHVPQDIWVGGGNVSGTWSGGGSVCLVGGILIAVNRTLGLPVTPEFDASEIQVLIVLKVVDGGPGSFTNPYTNDTDNFFLEAEITTAVSNAPPGFPIPPFELISRARLTFDYMEGRNIQDVTAWLYLDPPGVWIASPPPEFPPYLDDSDQNHKLNGLGMVLCLTFPLFCFE